MTEFNDLFLPIFLLGVICYWIIWLGSPSKSNLASGSNSASSWGYYHGVLAEGEFCALACLLEDAPIHVLKGQAYDLAIPLMTPLACLLEDAPIQVLKGQAYDLAIPLMTPLACLLEDAPIQVLKGQAYDLAIPLMTPLASILVDTWQKFYQTRLGKPGINYWEWCDKPVAKNVCPELSLLLDLPVPSLYSQEILVSLAEQKTLLLNQVHPHEKAKYKKFLNTGQDEREKCKFSYRSLDVQTQMIIEFKVWHETIKKGIGKNALSRIYRHCYSTKWQTIQALLKIVTLPSNNKTEAWWKTLGISRFSNHIQVKNAYKFYLANWHPDRNKHPIANFMTARINLAYEQYLSQAKAGKIAENKFHQINQQIQTKLSNWFNSSISD